MSVPLSIQRVLDTTLSTFHSVDMSAGIVWITHQYAKPNAKLRIVEPVRNAVCLETLHSGSEVSGLGFCKSLKSKGETCTGHPFQ